MKKDRGRGRGEEEKGHTKEKRRIPGRKEKKSTGKGNRQRKENTPSKDQRRKEEMP